jgi:hypothetical protein
VIRLGGGLDQEFLKKNPRYELVEKLVIRLAEEAEISKGNGFIYLLI